MNIYSEALDTYLKRADAKKQVELAEAAECTQAAISRYRTGKRFPDSQTAAALDGATGGLVSFTLWRAVAAERAGIAA